MQSKIIDDALKDIQRLREATREIAASSPDVLSGKVTVEDEMQEPAYLLYQDIMNTTAAYFESEPVKLLCQRLGESLGEKATADIMTLVSVGMAHAAHNAVLAYDDRLKSDLNKQFDLVINACNTNTADIRSFESALQVFRSQLTKLTGKDLLSQVFQGQNVQPDSK